MRYVLLALALTACSSASNAAGLPQVVMPRVKVTPPALHMGRCGQPVYKPAVRKDGLREAPTQVNNPSTNPYDLCERHRAAMACDVPASEMAK